MNLNEAQSRSFSRTLSAHSIKQPDLSRWRQTLFQLHLICSKGRVCPRPVCQWPGVFIVVPAEGRFASTSRPSCRPGSALPSGQLALFAGQLLQRCRADVSRRQRSRASSGPINCGSWRPSPPRITDAACNNGRCAQRTAHPDRQPLKILGRRAACTSRRCARPKGEIRNTRHSPQAWPGRTEQQR